MPGGSTTLVNFEFVGDHVSMAASRPSHIYSTNRQYSKVCIGFQVLGPDALIALEKA